MDLIIIAGMPATGKSTLARKLAAALSLPVFEKDEIKEAMFDTVGYADLPAKRQLDVTANAILLRMTEALLRAGKSLIAVNNFDRSMNAQVQAVIDRYDCRCVTIFLNGDPDVLYERYVSRDKQHLRHLGHTFIDRYPPLPGDVVGESMTRAYFNDRFLGSGMDDFRLKGARIELDATHPEQIDVQALLARLDVEVL